MVDEAKLERALRWAAGIYVGGDQSEHVPTLRDAVFELRERVQALEKSALPVKAHPASHKTHEGK